MFLKLLKKNPGQRISDKIKWAKEILTLYENVKF